MKSFPLSNGAPMHLLSEMGLHEAFLDTIERHRRDGLPLVLNRGGRTELVPADQLTEKVRAARQRIAELNAEIAQFQRPFSLNEMPPES
jgi:hypothetical protein